MPTVDVEAVRRTALPLWGRNTWNYSGLRLLGFRAMQYENSYIFTGQTLCTGFSFITFSFFRRGQGGVS